MTSRCSHCGKELQTRNFALPGHRPILVTMPCDCPRAAEERARAQMDAEQSERVEAFAKAWTRVGIPEIFLHVDADFAALAPIGEGRSLYLVGENGRGKTHAACRVAKAYLSRHTRRQCNMMGCWRTAKFVTAQDVLSRLKASWDRWGETEEDVFQRLAGTDLLILDDLGKGVPTEWASENLFRLIDMRWSNGKPMVITSQYGIEELADRYERTGDETMGAIISRLRGWCDVIRFDGPDLRLIG